MCLYSNIGALEVYYNIYKIGAPEIFDYLSKRSFSAIVTCAKKRANMVFDPLKFITAVLYV